MSNSSILTKWEKYGCVSLELISYILDSHTKWNNSCAYRQISFFCFFVSYTVGIYVCSMKSFFCTKCKNMLFLSVWLLGQRNRNNKTYIDFVLAISCWSVCVRIRFPIPLFFSQWINLNTDHIENLCPFLFSLATKLV